MASRMIDGASNTNVAQRLKQKSPESSRVLRIGGVLAGIVTVMVAGTTAVGGTMVALLVASPLLILFSPVLVPLAIAAAVVLGCLVSFLAVVAMVAWLYKYVKGRRPVGANQVDAAKNRIVDTASQVTEKAREVGSNVSGYLHNKTNA
ncbi:oleosin 1 [Selaginella moellendorffii]|nr:oleosin 1 [Selaginella moellendorffii]XP_002978493.2 oleosin 1 [Selaginella moellendorffii]|eukprot:XP_002970414.2 oleosin 1 [Selaginella moellendorffii]